MKQLVLLVAMCFAMAAFAQSGDNMKKDKGMDMAGKTKTVTGCIHKEGDNFWLKTRMGSYHLMSKDDLTAHDGHEVKATGTESKGPVPGDSSGKKVKHLDLTNVDMVADHCKMGSKKAPKEPKSS